MAQSFVSVTSTATLLAPAANPSAPNYTVAISAPATGNVCYVGQSAVTTSTGAELRPGSSMILADVAAAVYAVCPANTQVTLSVAVNVS